MGGRAHATQDLAILEGGVTATSLTKGLLHGALGPTPLLHETDQGKEVKKGYGSCIPRTQDKADAYWLLAV